MQSLDPLVIYHIMCLLPYPTLVSLLACSKRLSFEKLAERKRAYILSTLTIYKHYVEIDAHDLPLENIITLHAHSVEVGGNMFIERKNLEHFQVRWGQKVPILQHLYHLWLPLNIQTGYIRIYESIVYSLYGRPCLQLICKSLKEMKDVYVAIYPTLECV